MQAVILAAGRSSRFYPYTDLPHKSFMTVLGKPLIVHTLESLKKSGITDVVIVVSKVSQIPEILGNGEQFGIQIEYAIQDNPQGQGDALLSAKEKITGDFFLLHAHRVDFSEYKDELLDAHKDDNIVLLAREEEDVTSFGALKVEGNKVVDIVEKPKKGDEPSHLRIIGIYLLNMHFLEVLEKTPPEHYHLEKALVTYAKNHTVVAVKTNHPAFSLKYPWHVFALKDYLLSKMKEYRAPTSQIASTVTISGTVHIGENAKILENVIIKGPCFIGDNTLVGDGALLRDNTSIEEGTRVGAFTEVKNTLLREKSTIHSGFLGDSVIGVKCKIGAMFATANVRLDRTSVKVEISDQEINSGLRDLGVIMGDNVKVGTRVSIMPGKIIGGHALIGPSTTVMKNVDPKTSYYTKVSEVVEKKIDENVPRPLILFDIDYTLFDTDIFKQSGLEQYALFEEILDILITLGQSADLGIFSQGEYEFQKEKLMRTDIYDFFLEKNVHIVNSKEETMKEILESYSSRQIFLVDDKLDVLYMAKKHLPHLHTVWVKRGIFFLQQQQIEGFTPDTEVDNLQDLPSLLSL